MFGSGEFIPDLFHMFGSGNLFQIALSNMWLQVQILNFIAASKTKSNSYFPKDYNNPARLLVNPFHHNPGRREKNEVKFLFSHFFVVPQKVLWRP